MLKVWLKRLWRTASDMDTLLSWIGGGWKAGFAVITGIATAGIARLKELPSITIFVLGLAAFLLVLFIFVVLKYLQSNPTEKLSRKPGKTSYRQVQRPDGTWGLEEKERSNPSRKSPEIGEGHKPKETQQRTQSSGIRLNHCKDAVIRDGISIGTDHYLTAENSQNITTERFIHLKKPNKKK